MKGFKNTRKRHKKTRKRKNRKNKTKKVVGGGTFGNRFKAFSKFKGLPKSNTPSCGKILTCKQINRLGDIEAIKSDEETAYLWYNKMCNYIYYKFHSSIVFNEIITNKYKNDFISYLCGLNNNVNCNEQQKKYYIYTLLPHVEEYVYNLVLDHYKKHNVINPEMFYSDNPILKKSEYDKFNTTKLFDIKPYTTGDLSRLLGDVLKIHKNYSYDEADYTPYTVIHDYDSFTLINNRVYTYGNIFGMIYGMVERKKMTNENRNKPKNKRVNANTNGYSIILSPEYLPEAPRQQSMEIPNINKIIYNYYDPYLMTPQFIRAEMLDKVSFVQDAFINKAVYVIDPRLAYLMHFQMPTLCTEYFVKLFEIRLDGIDKITILTLLKYAAMKRFMWTKDPKYAAQVYLVDPQLIIHELYTLDTMLPDTTSLPKEDFKDGYTIFDDKFDSSKLYTLTDELPLENVPYSNEYTKEQFLIDINEELQSNQKWLCKCVKYKNYDNFFEKTNGKFSKNVNEKIMRNNMFWPNKNNFKPGQKIKILRRRDIERIIDEKIAKSKGLNAPPPPPPPEDSEDDEEKLPEPPAPPE
jgi:hypothetical protein